MRKNRIDKTDWRPKRLCRRSICFLLVSMFLTAASTAEGQSDAPLGLIFSGDFRLRYERTTRQEPGNLPDIISDPRNRGVVRLRAGLTKRINEYVNLGARLATGALDDPNTADVTLGNFVNDLEVNLDRVYLQLTYKDAFVTGGKFANPFMTTDLVWDGDVNPQGLAAMYSFSKARLITPTFVGMYAIVDEQTVDPDSYFWGGQMQLSINPDPDWKLTLAGGYYDYTIKSLGHADDGDIRSNYLNANATSYISDFNLVDVIAMVEYRGLSPRLPLRFVGDFVKNRGARVNEDQGFGLDVYIGPAAERNDLRFQYGYSQTETDAVLAAFSHDNTTIATNYQQHTVALDYVALDNTILNLTWYFYRRNKFEPLRGTEGDENEFFSRIRLNTVVKF